MIGAADCFHTCFQMPGNTCFSLHLSDSLLSAKSAFISDKAPDLSQIPKEYHDYANVFSKAEADKLAPHQPYDLKIDLEEGTSPPPITAMYSLFPAELETLHEFIDENLRQGFICAISLPHGAPVLFSSNSNGSLHLCINYRGLNHISKKDHYPLPLISDLLATAGIAQIYTTVDRSTLVAQIYDTVWIIKSL